MMQHMKDGFNTQMQRGAPPHLARASQLSQPMPPIQQVRLTPHNLNQYPQYRSMNSYPPSGMASQSMHMRYPGPINYGEFQWAGGRNSNYLFIVSAMPYPSMQLPYGSQMMMQDEKKINDMMRNMSMTGNSNQKGRQ